MKYKLQWKKTVADKKYIYINNIEEFYLLTYKDVYKELYSWIKDDLKVWHLLFYVYIEFYKNVKDISDIDNSRNLIFKIISDQVNRYIADNLLKKDEIKKNVFISEERAATILIQIEEEMGLLDEIEDSSNLIIIVVKIVVTIILVYVCIVSLFKISFYLNRDKKVSNSNLIIEIDDSSTKEDKLEVMDYNIDYTPEVTVNEPEHSPGWLINDDKFIYFIDDNLEKAKGSLEIDGIEFYFNEEGELITFNDQDKDNFNVNDTIQHLDHWIYYLIETSGTKKYNLYRVLEESATNWKELILEDIQDYYLMENDIIFLKDNQLDLLLNINEREFNRENQEVHLISINEGFYLANEINDVMINDFKDTYLQIEDRQYRIKDAKIKYVKPNNSPIKGITYFINNDDSKLYWKNTKGESGRFVGEGISIDSYCIVDDWVYYSVCIRVEGNKRYSQIRRIKTDGTVREVISLEFQGNMTNMYYYQELGFIYSEYLPNISQYGKVAQITLNGDVYIIGDNIERSTEMTTGEDMLEIIMVDDQKIYCYWHDCDWNNANGIKILWSKPILLSVDNKIELVKKEPR